MHIADCGCRKYLKTRKADEIIESMHTYTVHVFCKTMHPSLTVLFVTCLAALAATKPVKNEENQVNRQTSGNGLRFVDIIQEVFSLEATSPDKRSCSPLIDQSLPFPAEVMDSAYWAESDLVLVKHFIGSLAVESFKKKFKKRLNVIREEADVLLSKDRENSKTFHSQLGEVLRRIDRMISEKQGEDKMVEMLNEVKSLLVSGGHRQEVHHPEAGSNAQVHREAAKSKREALHPKAAAAEPKEVVNSKLVKPGRNEIPAGDSKKMSSLLKEVSDLLDDVDDLEDVVSKKLELFCSRFWDWLQDQPLRTLKNLFCGMVSWTASVEVDGDGLISVNDGVYDWGDLVEVCCFHG